jgi:putative ABC transport system permease protein
LKPYIFHITLYDVAFIGTIFIGLTFILLLWFIRSANRAANLFLVLAMVTTVLWITRLLCINIGVSTYFNNWSWIPLQFSLALGPLIFFYVLNTIRPGYKFMRKHLLHLLPLLLQLGAHGLQVIDSTQTGAATYNTSTYKQLNPALLLLTFVSVIIYLHLSYRLIGRFYRELKFTDGDRHIHHLQWLHRLLNSFGVLWLLWIPVTIAGYFYYQLSIQAYYLLHVLLAAVIIWIGAVAFLRQEVGVQALNAPLLKPRLPAEMKQRGIWLKKAVQANLYYQDPELSLSLLAEKLELGPHELSRIINTVLKKSFNDFINEYRVADLVQKLQDPAYNHITLLGIAFESGFNSKTTFNRTFKQITGKSPAEYKNELKKERPFYNMGRYTRLTAIHSFHETTPKWSHEKSNRKFMFKNYFKIAWRNLVRNKSYATINITGLAVGIAVCMMIFFIIQFHSGFDIFHSKKDRIYRVLTEYHNVESADISYGKDVPFPMPVGLKTAFPQIEQIAPIFASQNDEMLIVSENGNTEKKFKEQRGYFTQRPHSSKYLISRCLPVRTLH